MEAVNHIILVVLAVATKVFSSADEVKKEESRLKGIDGVQFFLSTKAVRDVEASITGNTLFGDKFDPTKQTKILIHGYLDNSNYGIFIPRVRDAYVNAQDVNVIGVDWSWWDSDNYATIANVYLRVVAKRIAQFLKMMTDQYEIDLSKIHIIGHSLGAHTAGMVGLLVQKIYNGTKLGRITGLDPAGEGFLGQDLKLTEHCADFVDAVHSDDYGFGLPEMNSHVDFYVNGGREQPACDNWPGACSHNMAHAYWASATLNATAFLAVRCDSWISFELGFCCEHEKTYMGEDTSRQARGPFYLVTTGEPPYGLGKSGVVVTHEGWSLGGLLLSPLARYCATN